MVYEWGDGGYKITDLSDFFILNDGVLSFNDSMHIEFRTKEEIKEFVLELLEKAKEINGKK
ncbi:MAG: hypothetical protein WC284_08190 [Candidimonas sp.]